MTGRRGRLLAGAMLALAFGAAAPSAASATYYTIKFSPSSVPSGSRATVSAKITRVTAEVPVRSANITAPSGFRLVSAALGEQAATVAGNTAQLRHLDLDRVSSTTARLVVDTPCSPRRGRWSFAAKQDGDYTGDTVDDHGNRPQVISTTGTCALRFTTQPAATQVGSTISGAAGRPIAVGIFDGAGRPANAATPVTIGLGTAPAGAALNGTKTVTATKGVATFDSLSVTRPGTYTLTATSRSATSATSATTSRAFRVAQDRAPCPSNVLCTVSASVTGTVPGSSPPIPYTNTVDVSAPPNRDVRDDSGTLSVSYNTGPDISCRGYETASPDREVILGPNREKIVSSTVSRALLAARGRTASSLRTCLLAPYPFSLGLLKPKARAVGDVDGDGNIDYLGLLPHCFEIIRIGSLSLLVGPPCQVSARTDSAGNAVVRYRLPADPRDPAGRH